MRKEYYLAVFEISSLQEQRKRLNAIAESICEQEDPLSESLSSDPSTLDESFESRSEDSEFDLEEEVIPRKVVKKQVVCSKPITRRTARQIAEAKSKKESQVKPNTRSRVAAEGSVPVNEINESDVAHILATMRVNMKLEYFTCRMVVGAKRRILLERKNLLLPAT